jgi:hypothetical protein
LSTVGIGVFLVEKARVAGSKVLLFVAPGAAGGGVITGCMELVCVGAVGEVVLFCVCAQTTTVADSSIAAVAPITFNLLIKPRKFVAFVTDLTMAEAKVLLSIMVNFPPNKAKRPQQFYRHGLLVPVNLDFFKVF